MNPFFLRKLKASALPLLAFLGVTAASTRALADDERETSIGTSEHTPLETLDRDATDHAIDVQGQQASQTSQTTVADRAGEVPLAARFAIRVPRLALGYPQPYPQQYPQQYPPQQPYPQQYPPQQYPQQYPPQQYPQQYPPQQYPQQYPPQQYPQQYPPQQYQPYPQQPYPQQPQSNKRSEGELWFMLGTGAAYGVGTGIMIDLLAKADDPGLAVIAPIGLGLAVPAGLFAVDYYTPFHKGVPAAISTGLLLGAVEGIAIGGTQWQLTSGDRGTRWSAGGYAALTFLTATGGGIGGYFFGEFARPDPRSMLFVSSGAAWGALTGTALGLGASKGDFPKAADPAAVLGLILYNGGIAGTGALSLVWTPSYNSLKAMWAGYAIGALAGCIVYPFYLANPDADPRHGLVANAVGGLAGLVVGAALTYNSKDPGQGTWKPPFQVGVAPNTNGGATLSAFGEW